MTSFLFESAEDRRDPGTAPEDGNYLAFAIGCRWLAVSRTSNRPQQNPNGNAPERNLALERQTGRPRVGPTVRRDAALHGRRARRA